MNSASTLSGTLLRVCCYGSGATESVAGVADSRNWIRARQAQQCYVQTPILVNRDRYHVSYYDVLARRSAKCDNVIPGAYRAYPYLQHHRPPRPYRPPGEDQGAVVTGWSPLPEGPCTPDTVRPTAETLRVSQSRACNTEGGFRP